MAETPAWHEFVRISLMCCHRTTFPPVYFISNLFSNLEFGNSNMLLSEKKNEIFVGDR